MDPDVQLAGSTKAGTIGGTVLVLFINLSSAELAKTVILAALGAAVSFSVSMLLKFLIKYVRRK